MNLNQNSCQIFKKKAKSKKNCLFCLEISIKYCKIKLRLKDQI